MKQLREKNKSSGVTLRALVIGLLLIPINSYWVVDMEVIRLGGQPTMVSLFFNTVFILLVLTVLSYASALFSQKFALSRRELLVIYIMLNMASAVGGHDILAVLVPILGHAFWFATPENDWKALFHRYIPEWLSVQDKGVLQGYYEGDTSLYASKYLLGWLEPVLWWSLLLTLICFVMLCINLIIRKQWTENEKLSYPIIQLPLEMTSKKSRFFTNKMMWIGFGLAAGLDIINGIHLLIPAVPKIPIKIGIGSYFTEKPWNMLGGMKIYICPFTIGLGCLVPLDLSFSCWFFYLFWQVERIFGSIVGWRGLPGFPYIQEQTAGAFLAICVIALWKSRKHLMKAFRQAIGKKGDPADTQERRSIRWGIFGIVGGMFFIMIFCQRAGMSIWVVPIFFAIYFAISTAITRIRAELGSPAHDLHHAGPDQLMPMFFGVRRFEPADLTIFSLFWGFNRAYRSHPMPHQLEAFKMAERANIDNMKLAFAIMLAVAVGSIAGFWAFLHLGYKVGMATRAAFPSITHFGREPFDQLQRWLSNPGGANYIGSSFLGVGFLFAVFLMAMRVRFFWWPFHPAGYAISGSWAMNLFWASFFFSWLMKGLVLKYGGIKAHRKLIPFCLGLILGQYVTGSLWDILGIILKIPTYSFELA